MHDVLDPRDLVPDEAEQLRLAGYPVGPLETEARAAAAAGDLNRLADLDAALVQLRRPLDWPYHEPDDDASLVALADAVAPTGCDADALPARVRGAWLGRAVGNTLGKPIEGLTRTQVELYLRAADQWPQTGYVPLLDPLPDGVPHLHPSAPVATAGRFVDVPRDDDIDWTILNLYLMERYGTGLTTTDIAAQWLDRVPFTQTYTAERAAYRNLIHGIAPPETATRANPYREWIGAQIRSDGWAYVCAGKPELASEFAYRDACWTHERNGIYGEMFCAAMQAAAFVERDPAKLVAIGLSEIPAECRLARYVRQAVGWVKECKDFEACMDRIDAALPEMSPVHTINNALICVISLFYGKMDTTATIATSVMCALDTDCNGATVGSIVGAAAGKQRFRPELAARLNDTIKPNIIGFQEVRMAELAKRTYTQWLRVEAWLREKQAGAKPVAKSTAAGVVGG